MVWGNCGLKLLYKESDIGKYTYDRLLKPFWLVVLKVVWKLLKYQVYYLLSNLGACDAKLLPHLLEIDYTDDIIKDVIADTFFDDVSYNPNCHLIFLIFFFCFQRATGFCYESTLIRSHMSFSISIAFVKSDYLG